jgi:hypothetical protein
MLMIYAQELCRSANISTEQTISAELRISPTATSSSPARPLRTYCTCILRVHCVHYCISVADIIK